LTIHISSIHLLGCRFSILFPVKGYKSKPLAGVVDIGHHPELLKLGLEVAIGHVLVYAVDEELAALLSHCDDVWILKKSGTTTGYSEKR